MDSTRIKYYKSNGVLYTSWFITQDMKFVRVYISGSKVTIVDPDDVLEEFKYSSLQTAKKLIKSKLVNKYKVDFNQEVRGNKYGYK